MKIYLILSDHDNKFEWIRSAQPMQHGVEADFCENCDVAYIAIVTHINNQPIPETFRKCGCHKTNKENQ